MNKELPELVTMYTDNDSRFKPIPGNELAVRLAINALNIHVRELTREGREKGERWNG